MNRQPSDLAVGDRVRIRYYTRDPEEATVVELPTRDGWVTVEQDYDGEVLRFQAAVEFTERVGK